MKLKFYLIALALFSNMAIFAQVVAEQTNFNYNLAYCVGSSNSTAWIGDEIVLMIEGETPSDRNIQYMTQAIEVFENIYSGYASITGLNNLPNQSSYNGKTVVEIVLDNCGAGGLAHHGAKGMSTGVDLFDRLYNSIRNNNLAVPQVFFYEINRNFWSPRFNDKFDWAMNNDPSAWGWWTVGMNNAQAVMLSASLDYELDYFGQDRKGFRDRMVKNLDDYINDTQYDFEFGWKQSLMPWNDRESINDLMSGLLIYSYENFGGDQFLNGLYRYLRTNEIPNRSGVFAFQECRDNIYKIWSFSAGRDLVSFFEDDLRWIISQDAKDDVSVTLTVDEFDKDSAGLKIYPNPTNDLINISTTLNNSLTEINIYNTLGQRVFNESFNELNEVAINVSAFEAGMYFIKHENFVTSFIKK